MIMINNLDKNCIYYTLYFEATVVGSRSLCYTESFPFHLYFVLQTFRSLLSASQYNQHIPCS